MNRVGPTANLRAFDGIVRRVLEFPRVVIHTGLVWLLP
jgi:hypothetical protein